MSSKIKTKYGNASLTWKGYYKITSSKEGNYLKFLHRVIYEDYYKVTVLDYAVVHHLDGNPKNNNIENLTLMLKSEHTKYHQSNIKKQKKKYKDKTGLYQVSINKAKHPHKIKFAYNCKINGKQKVITSINLNKLYYKVISKGLKWKIIDLNKANVFCNEHGYVLKGNIPVKL